MDIQVNVTIDIAQSLKDVIRGISAIRQPQVAEQVKAQPTVTEAQVKPEVQQHPVTTTAEAAEVATTSQDSGEEQVSLGTVRDKVSELIRAGRKSQIVAILDTYGVTGYSQLKGVELNQFYNEITKL